VLEDLAVGTKTIQLAEDLLKQTGLDRYYDAVAVNLLYMGRALAAGKTLEEQKVKNGGKVNMTIKKDAKVHNREISG